MGNSCCKQESIASYICKSDVWWCKHVNWDNIDANTPELSFRGMRRMCKVVSIYDGDTIRVVFPLNGKLYKWNCRINNVDTPELRTKYPLEKEFGYVVRDKLREKILNKVIYIVCGNFDKYGRLLITPYIDGLDISQWLIDNDYAFYYKGGKKQSWYDYLLKKKMDKIDASPTRHNNKKSIGDVQAECIV